MIFHFPEMKKLLFEKKEKLDFMIGSFQLFWRLETKF